MAPVLPLLLRQTRAEVLKTVRIPAQVVFILVFPSLLYGLFGTLYGDLRGPGGVYVGTILLAGYGAYSMSGAIVFSFGIGLAIERGQRQDVLMRATPLPPWVYFLARGLAIILFATLSLALIFAFAALIGKAHLTLLLALQLAWRLIFGSIPFIGFGFALGYLLGPSNAPPVVNLIFIPMAFASGILIPLSQLPAAVQTIAPFLPTYHLGQLALEAAGDPSAQPAGRSVLGLLIWGVIFFAVAFYAYRRDALAKFS